MVVVAVDEPILPFLPRCSRLLQHGETVKAKRAGRQAAASSFRPFRSPLSAPDRGPCNGSSRTEVGGSEISSTFCTLSQRTTAYSTTPRQPSVFMIQCPGLKNRAKIVTRAT